MITSKYINQNYNFDILTLKKTFNNNVPFKNIVIDNLFNNSELDSILKEYPTIENMPRKFLNKNENKYASKDIYNMKNIKNCLGLLEFLNSKQFINFIEEITGINNLIPDKKFDGGGLHQIPNKGKLNIHIDFNKKKMDNNYVDRRVNLLLYLNKNWEEHFNGSLELWDGKKCIKSIMPIFNRTVIFNTTSKSWHGHPVPLNCKKNTRKSIAVYYYTINNNSEDFENCNLRNTIFLKDIKKNNL